MKVVKRSGSVEDVKLDKVTNRVKALSDGLKIDAVVVAQKTITYLKDRITTKEIDKLLAETAAWLATEHPHYSKVAGRIVASSIHKETGSFYDSMKKMQKAGMLSESFEKLVREHGKKLEKMIDYDRDFNFDYFGIMTLSESYLTQIADKVIERPQHLFMRVALAICGSDLEAVEELYDLMSLGYYTHATPTLFNAGLKCPQLSSCYLQGIESDSIEGIFNTLKECALISKYAGGIGLHIHNVRAQKAVIKSTGRKGDGIVPMLKVFSDTVKYVNQGGKRKGSAAIYLEPWHADVEAFLEIKKQETKEEHRASNLWTAMWVPDLFMERAEADGDWTLFSPDEAPGLSDVYGEEFKKLYELYESEGRGRKTMKARDLLSKITVSQIETGAPYITFKDHANKKSNQQNIGTIKSSNLCAEIMEVSNSDETAVCNLASLCLPKYVKMKTKEFDFKKLGEVVRVAVRNLNKVIDINFYPTDKTQRSNMSHRPVGLGVQGLHTAFMMLGFPYDSEDARKLNREIAETIYYNAVLESCKLAESQGTYNTYEGSPMSRGVFQFDMWGITPSDRHDWQSLKELVKKHGVRNSLLVALMPTASTAQIFGNSESFEPMTTNLFKRQVLAGEFVVINGLLIEALEKRSLWSPEMKAKLLEHKGSIQEINEIPEDLKQLFKTVWEISQKSCIEMAADRGAFICQSQSMNLFIADPNSGKIGSAIMYGWKKGLKTGCYYLKSRAKKDAVNITVEVRREAIQETKSEEVSSEEALACSLDNPEACDVCGS